MSDRDTVAASPPSLARRLLPLALLLVLGTIWGAVTSISKYIALEGVPPTSSVFWQASGAALILLVIARTRGGRVPLAPRYLVYYTMVGFIGYAMPNANMVFATAHIPAGLMAVIIMISPVLTYMIALTIGMERLQPARVVGIALGFAGAAVLVLPRGSLPTPDMLPFALAAFVTPLCYAIGNIWAERSRPTDMDSVSLASGMLFAAAIGMGAAAIIDGSFYPIWRFERTIDFAMIGYSVLTVLPFLLYFEILRLSGAVFLSQVSFVVTLTGLGWAALIYGEQPSVWVWVAVVLVFAGVGLVNFGKGGDKAGKA